MSYSFSYNPHAQSVHAGALAPQIVSPFKAASDNRKPAHPKRNVEPAQPTDTSPNQDQYQDPGTYNANGQKTPTPLGNVLDIRAA